MLAAALLFSTGGAAIKSATLDGWQVASFRSLAAAAAVVALMPSARRNWNWRTLLVGFSYAATLILFVQATKLTSAANAIFLQSAAPFYLLLLGPWLLKEPVRRADALLMVFVGLGVALVFLGSQAPLRTAPDPRTGNVLAVFSGAAWALTLAGLRWLGGRGGSGEQGMATVAAGNVLACLLSLAKALPVAFSVHDILVIGYLGVFQIGLAYLFLTRGVRSVTALECSLLLLAEPALNPVWAALVHGENPGAFSLAGGALILAASLGRALRRENAAC